MRIVNRPHTGRPQTLLRKTALILALIFLSISGGTTLNHTEDGIFSMRVHAGASALTHGAAAASADSCAACQWENSVFSPQVPAVLLPAPMLVSLPVLAASVQTRFPHLFDHTSPRAPPRVA